MNESIYNEQEMIRYLLGALPEAEAERFDALSISDLSFTEQLSVTENGLVDAYVQGELTGDILSGFETYYLSSPFRREKVEFARALQKHAEQSLADRSENLAEELRAKRATARPFWTSFFQGQGVILQWGALAALLVAAGVLWNLHRNSQQVVSVVLAPPVRGSDHIATLSIPGRTSQIDARLELEPGNFPPYRVVLTAEADTTELWRSESLSAQGASDNRYLSLRFPARLLRSQVYSLVVSGTGPNGESEIIGNYPFRAQVK
jgi:hypothetical protein